MGADAGAPTTLRKVGKTIGNDTICMRVDDAVNKRWSVERRETPTHEGAIETSDKLGVARRVSITCLSQSDEY
jgi:hypothetical protein